jgi:hypothetical protein
VIRNLLDYTVSKSPFYQCLRHLVEVALHSHAEVRRRQVRKLVYRVKIRVHVRVRISVRKSWVLDRGFITVRVTVISSSPALM